MTPGSLVHDALAVGLVAPCAGLQGRAQRDHHGGAGSHGCTTVACTKDGDCDCGYCVNGSCLSGLGHCSFPPA